MSTIARICTVCALAVSSVAVSSCTAPVRHPSDTELANAIEQRESAEVYRLLRARPDLLERDDAVFYLRAAILAGRASTVAHLLQFKPQLVDIPFDNYTPLQLAAARGDPGLVALLLDFGADANARSKSQSTPLMAASNRYVAGVLLAHGAEPNARNTSGRTALHFAAQLEHPDIVDMLLGLPVEVSPRDEFNSTPLHGAATWGAAESVSLLLNSGADPDAQDNDGSTPLHREIMARWRSGPVDTLLINSDMNLDVQDERGHTPLNLAVLYQRLGTIEQLLDSGADIELPDRRGNTPLHSAVHSNNPEITQRLISAGADVDATNLKQSTPLHLAKSPVIAAALLKAGASPTARDAFGLTPIERARRLGRQDVVEAIEQFDDNR